MRTEIEDWKNGWFGIRLAIAPDEIDALIAQLQMLKGDREQHFHLQSDYKGAGGIGDIEISVQQEGQLSNMEVTSKAMLPGEFFERGPV